MKRVAKIFLVVVCVVGFAFPGQLFGGSDDFQNLEFFLERALKNSKDSTERNEVINRYLLKALALVYQQNKEQVRLDREALNVSRGYVIGAVGARSARERSRRFDLAESIPAESIDP